MAAHNDKDKNNVLESEADLSPARFNVPVKSIHREQDAQIVSLVAIERLAETLDGDDVRETVAYVPNYLEFEGLLHVKDEERDLFAHLAERAMVEDGFGDIPAALQGAHEAGDAYCCMLMADRRSSRLQLPGPRLRRVSAPSAGVREQCACAAVAVPSRYGRYGRYGGTPVRHGVSFYP